jgi:hypothetical protein
MNTHIDAGKKYRLKSEKCLILLISGQNQQDLLDIFLAFRMETKDFNRLLRMKK